MIINKFQGKTKEEAIEKARAEYGSKAVIMNVREIKPKGLFKAFSSSTYEVTAAMEEKEEKVSPLAALMKEQPKRPENINLAADEKIDLSDPYGRDGFQGQSRQQPNGMVQGYQDPPRAVSGRSARDSERSTAYSGGTAGRLRDRERTEGYGTASGRTGTVPGQSRKENNIEQRLDDLSSMLQERLGVSAEKPRETQRKPAAEELNFLRVLYKTLVDNEVNEKYVNQIMDEVEKLISPGKSVDSILANVYQKLILRFGQPRTIELSGRKPRVIFFVGPTGVGKTTTIAKIASRCKMERDRKVAFITADTYRIAATEQLRVYANILDAPMEIVYEVEELNNAVKKMASYDLIFVDTAGFSHKNGAQKEDIKRLIQGLDTAFEREVHLVLSATTKYPDLLEIVDTYREITEFKIIFTKLDETSCYGNMLNVRLYSNADLSYATTGQNVPDDLEVFDSQKIVKQLLGGR